MYLEFKDFRIITDERQYIVQKKRLVKPGKFTKEENVGKEVYDDIAYCGTLEFALKFLSNKLILDNDDLKVIQQELRLLRAKIKEFIALLNQEVEIDE